MMKSIIGNEKEKVIVTRTNNNILCGSVSYLKAKRVNKIKGNEGGTNNVEITLAIRCFVLFCSIGQTIQR
jgi:hypothetical protein